MSRLRLLFVFLATFCATRAVTANEREINPADDALVSGPRAANVAELTLLNTVLHKTADDYYRWAYTEHRVMRDTKGRIKSDVVIRHDPSKPYPEQWIPISIDGRQPSERDRAQYRKRGEKAARARQGPGGMPNPDNRRRRSLGELIEVMNASVASETLTHLVYDVPLLKVGNERFPPEKFQVLVRVKKEGPQLENVSVRLRESFRSKLIVKVESGEGSLDFAIVDPQYPPALVAIEGGAEASILFINVGGSMELKRTALKHVQPYDERFEVQIGTLKAIDF